MPAVDVIANAINGERRMVMAPSFVDAFKGRCHQAFFYLIDQCNLNCVHCLYKQELTFQMTDKQIPFIRAVDMMKNLRDLGAIKVTFMGGEPTLYKQLPDLIHIAKQLGFLFVRIDTNGTFPLALLDHPYMKELDEITFSLDGPNPEVNDAIRGPGVFDKCLSRIKRAVELGYVVQITTCVQRKQTHANPETGKLYLIEMVELAKSLGIQGINMHDLFKAGIPRDTFSGDVGTSVSEYMNAFAAVFNRFEAKDKDGFHVRMPACVTTQEKFNSNPSYFGYCSVKQMDRLLIFPNGQLRVCSLMIGSPYCIGYYDDDRVYLNETPTNETRDHDMQKYTPCTCQSKGRHFGRHVPLCVSFKPGQEEIVWIKSHKWERRRDNPSSLVNITGELQTQQADRNVE